MAGFSYYLPNLRAPVTLEQLHAAGLGYVFGAEGEWNAREVMQNGPDGGRGCVVVRTGASQPARLGYFRESQGWRPISRAANQSEVTAWVGFETDARPTPEDLARERQLQGHLVELADGNKWLVPIARSWVEEGGTTRWEERLPQVLDRDEEGQWVPGDVLAAYRPLHKVAVAYFDSLFQAEEVNGGVQLTIGDIIDSACGALLVNYRLGPNEVAALGLLTVDLAIEVMQAVIDWPALKALEKKTATAGPSINAGHADTTPATVPA